MKIKKYVYVVQTEYQFLQSVNLALNKYDDDCYSNIIYVLRCGKRLSGLDLNCSSQQKLQIHLLENQSPRNIADTILSEDAAHFLIFQGNSPINVFLATVFSKRGVEVSLGPDGYSMYAVYKKEHSFITLIKDSIEANLYLLKNKLFSGKIHRFDYYKYGNHNFIDNLWVTHPKKYVHQADNNVNILKLPDLNKKCIEFVEDCFKFNENFPIEDAIYYFNQPLKPELIEAEMIFLKDVLKKFSNKKIILKLHPLTPKYSLQLYQKLDRLQIIESSAPAEILLIKLKNCIVFTGWSTVLMMENSRCNYYFNYPIYKNTNVKSIRQSDMIILDHITLVDKPELMEFPNG